MNAFSEQSEPAPRWLRGWAILTVVATAVLLALGTIVTTFRVGMADPVWPTSPLYLLFTDWHEPRPGFLIEHGHRAAAWFVGCCVIVLAAGLALSAVSRALKVLGAAALGCVVGQGLLGGFRVRLHELFGPDLAVVHGVFAPIVFSVLVSVAVLLSPWYRMAMLAPEEARRLRRVTLCVTALTFLQIVWGARLRHLGGEWMPRLHLFTAFGVVAASAWLAARALSRPLARQALRGPLCVLGGLLFLQVALGIEAWMSKSPEALLVPQLEHVRPAQAAIRLLHVLVGAGLLATVVVCALVVYRPAEVVEPALAPRIHPEGTS